MFVQLTDEEYLWTVTDNSNYVSWRSTDMRIIQTVRHLAGEVLIWMKLQLQYKAKIFRFKKKKTLAVPLLLIWILTCTQNTVFEAEVQSAWQWQNSCVVLFWHTVEICLHSGELLISYYSIQSVAALYLQENPATDQLSHHKINNG